VRQWYFGEMYVRFCVPEYLGFADRGCQFMQVVMVGRFPGGLRGALAWCSARGAPAFPRCCIDNIAVPVNLGICVVGWF